MTDTVGSRIKDLRERLGISQAELVKGLYLSPSYVSLIETGRRRPRERILEAIAERLGCSAEYLRTGRGGPGADDIELELRFAELALRSGDAETARRDFDQARRHAETLKYRELELEALWGVSRAEEALGNLDPALRGFQRLVDEPTLPGTVSRTLVLTLFCHSLVQCGDLTKAIELGEAAMRTLDEQQSAPAADEAIELACTLVGCYYERGDLMQAQLLAERTLVRAEFIGSSRARAGAYWEAGLVAGARGDLRAARRFTERALALYSEADIARAVGVLSVNCAWLILRLPEPDVSAAHAHLNRALDILPKLGNPVEVAWAETELARCRVFDGLVHEALGLATAALGRLTAAQPLEAARAHAVIGDAHLAAGDNTQALDAYLRAAHHLGNARLTRPTAAVWREIGDALAGLGAIESAYAAYRHMADCAGVPERARPGRPIVVANGEGPSRLPSG